MQSDRGGAARHLEKEKRELRDPHAVHGMGPYNATTREVFVDFRRRQLDSVQLKRHYESSSHRGAAKWDHERTAG
ncbi:hypothetical protein PI124_g19322 [Phytophthora idaei]|nr:hypothetical protein PI125_g20357 [Phytophthora idaei]KAG3134293.1 hypothetical protein PI126_g18753 [Phytophthora idaei]KAG3235651.1 hypothetical protein PI124_g19322 [Phytophthora idaei]